MRLFPNIKWTACWFEHMNKNRVWDFGQYCRLKVREAELLDPGAVGMNLENIFVQGVGVRKENVYLWREEFTKSCTRNSPNISRQLGPISCHCPLWDYTLSLVLLAFYRATQTQNPWGLGPKQRRLIEPSIWKRTLENVSIIWKRLKVLTVGGWGN